MSFLKLLKTSINTISIVQWVPKTTIDFVTALYYLFALQKHYVDWTPNVEKEQENVYLVNRTSEKRRTDFYYSIFWIELKSPKEILCDVFKIADGNSRFIQITEKSEKRLFFAQSSNHDFSITLLFFFAVVAAAAVDASSFLTCS